jgi:hypothetical protein
MSTQAIEISPLHRQDLKELGGATGPCLTILFSLKRSESNDRRALITLKSALQDAENRLKAMDVNEDEIRKMLAPVREFESEPEGWVNAGQSLAIFRSPDVFRWFGIPHEVREEVVVADHFFVLPMLTALTGEKQFYILALSQKRMRLLRCTERSSEEVPIAEGIPESYEEFLQMRRPEVAENDHADAGASQGKDRGGMSNADRDKADEHLYHYYQQISKGLEDMLRDDPAPIVAAAVEYEIGVFRRATKLTNLAEQAVFGAPDGLKGGDLHARALEAVAPEWERPLQRALDLYERQGGSDRASANPRHVVKAAFEARVAHLFVAEGARLSGNFDETAHRVHVSRQHRSGDEDLINAAALQTLLNGGDVFVIPRERVPEQSDLAAVLRY